MWRGSGYYHPRIVGTLVLTRLRCHFAFQNSSLDSKRGISMWASVVLLSVYGCPKRCYGQPVYFLRTAGIRRNMRVGVFPMGAKTTLDTPYNKISIQSNKIPMQDKGPITTMGERASAIF